MEKIAYSLDEENYYFENDMDSMLDNDENSDTKTLYKGETVGFTHSDFVFATDVIIEAKERAYNEVGGWCEGYLDNIDKEKLKELNSLICEWFNKNVEEPTFFTVKNVKEISVDEFYSKDNK